MVIVVDRQELGADRNAVADRDMEEAGD